MIFEFDIISLDLDNCNVCWIKINNYVLPYSRKIWRELYLAIWPPNAEIKYWRNLNFADLRLRSKISLRNSCVQIIGGN